MRQNRMPSIWMQWSAHFRIKMSALCVVPRPDISCQWHWLTGICKQADFQSWINLKIDYVFWCIGCVTLECWRWKQYFETSVTTSGLHVLHPAK
jgi:hypothetical protein